MNVRRIAAAAMLAGAGAVVAVGFGPAASANTGSSDVEQFVAIAYSPATGSWGWGNQYDSYNGAATRALSECQSHGGTNCEVTAWAKDGCAALAVKDGRYYGWYGPNKVAANSLALLKNHGGHILESRCSDN